MSSDPRVSEKLKALPASPGVYLLKDAGGEVLYVGKAASLRSRVRSYFQSPKGLSRKTRDLVREVDDLEVIRTANEVEAFLLEDSLIKERQPRFNIRLRDDKRYPYLKITREPFPRVLIVRRRQADGGRYFGPFTNTKAMRSTLKLAQKLFPTRTCALALPLPKPRRPCLQYHIGRCPGPCATLIDEAAYGEAVEGTAMLFEGRVSGLVGRLKERMAAAAAEERFEEAARVRDQITALTRTLERQAIALPDLLDRDVIGVAAEGDRACAQVFLVRSGRVTGREAFHLRAPGEPNEEDILLAFLTQYYAGASAVPPEVLLPSPIPDVEGMEAWLSSLRGQRVRIKVPARGEKRDLVHLASDNARFALKGEEVGRSLRGEATAALDDLAEVLSLSSFPERIEAFDISNTQGGEATGSMVVFAGGRPRRDAYRRFKVHLSGKPDDYAMMAEVLRRRLRRGLAELAQPGTSAKFSDLPDLVVVDGGKGQLSIALSVLRELGLEEIEALGLAKRHEEVYRPLNPEPIRLPADSPALLLLREVRDEAHRFAVTYHRRLRAKRSLSSRLDEIPGVGPKRRQALLRAFGSIERLAQASVDEIASVEAIPRSLAEAIAKRTKP